ncbi:hypothetical protein ACYFX5_09210 [Bremerella sp. T1]|uniref:hypothetical protein n=1 Tax=Bremerella sp. TYQ1 TaxID=3119568 RepID=UPI001CCFF67C|nr:hypothetical protein [Bremerella volcania]UBM38431.1 hypothetical protein LA756_11145 [Bremerella volcania]
MKQKRVRGGQKIGGNLSAAAINAINGLVERDDLTRLNKPGNRRPEIQQHGIFVDAEAHRDIAAGEWQYISPPLFHPDDVGENWGLGAEFYWATTQGTVGYGPGGRNEGLIPAMATESLKDGDVGRFQVAGVARTKVKFPYLASVPPQWSLYRQAYRTAHFSTADGVPIATVNDNGLLDVLWHDEPAGVELQDATVRWPAVPRSPRMLQIVALFDNTSSSSSSFTCDGYQYQTLTTPYFGINGTVSQRPCFLRAGVYKITANLWCEFGGVLGSGHNGLIKARVTKTGPSPPTNAVNIAGHWTNDLPDGPSIGHSTIFASGSQLWNVNSFDELYAEIVAADIQSANVRVQIQIEGPFNNDFPEVTTYVP